MTTGVLAESDKNRLKQKENLVDARGSLGVARPHFYTVPVVTEANRDSAWDRGLRGGASSRPSWRVATTPSPQGTTLPSTTCIWGAMR